MRLRPRRSPSGLALVLLGMSVLLASLGGMAVLTGGAEGAQQPPTHSMVLDAVADTVAADLLAGAAIPSGRPVVLASPAPGDTLGLLTQRLVERLRQRGIAVRITSSGSTSPLYGNIMGGMPGSGMQGSGMPGSGTPGDGSAVPGDSSTAVTHATSSLEGGRPLRVDLRVDGSGVTYVRKIHSFPFGTKGYERLAGMRASLTILDPESGDVLWARSSTHSATDVVRKKDVAYAASGSGRLNPPVPSGGTRWLEPLIVVGVVAGLVVLFYSNRN